LRHASLKPVSFVIRFVAPALLVVRCLPAAVPIGITITSNPAGLAFTVTGDGCGSGSYVTPQTLSWTPASPCAVTFASPQIAQSVYGTRYVFNGWLDGAAANPRTIAAPGQPATFTANFTTQNLLTTAALPAAAGTVTGGGWYNAGVIAGVTATAAGGYRLVNWSGVFAPPGFPGVAVVMSSPLSATANFVPILPGPPGQYVMTGISNFPTAPGKPTNNYGQVVGGTVAAGGNGFLWTPLLPNANAGTITDVGGVILPANPWGDLPHTAAAGINDRGQVVGTTNIQNGPMSVTAQAFLWSPNTPNATTGSVSPLPGGSVFPAFTPNPGFLEINSYGQVGGYLGFWTPSSFVWTTTSPNGQTGTVIEIPLPSGPLPSPGVTSSKASRARQRVALRVRGPVSSGSITAISRPRCWARTRCRAPCRGRS